MNKAPILFLFFNRKDTTLKVFEKIKEYQPHDLYLACDGARPHKNGEETIVQSLRKTIKESINWECNIHFRFLDENLGCRDAVSGAISWFFQHEEKGIILEDDCLPESSFFDFCSSMLDRYEHDLRISMITGTNYHIDMSDEIKEPYFFSNHYSIWGWATWRRAWEKYDITEKNWAKHKAAKNHLYVNNSFFAYKNYEYIFDLIANGEINAWGIQWTYTCLFQHGLCITPTKNQISNIGLDGTHTTKKVPETLFLKTHPLNLESTNHPQEVFPLYSYDHGFLYKYYKKVVILITMKHYLKKCGLFKPIKFLKDRLL